MQWVSKKSEIFFETFGYYKKLYILLYIVYVCIKK